MLNMKMSWVNQKLQVGISKIGEESGVFTVEKIKKGDVLSVFGGYVINIDEFENLSETLKKFSYQVSDTLLFGPVKEEDIEICEYFNHSCCPNAGFKDTITLVAMRDIEVCEEITFDYATCMTSSILDMECLCGRRECRKRITGEDWKRKDLQERYKEYFVPYIKEKILSQHFAFKARQNKKLWNL